MLLLTRPLIVATASPNRRAILTDAGLVFDTAVPEADESLLPGDVPEVYVRRLAEAKARSISAPSPDHLILTADTCVYLHGSSATVEMTSRTAAVRGRLQWLCRWRGRREPLKNDIEGDILGKPRDEHHARSMLKTLSGNWHEVWGGIALRDDRAGTVEVESVVTKVKFSKLSDEMIDWYVGTGEPFGRAGSYAIQGHGRALVSAVDGCFTNVIGISIPVVFAMLRTVHHTQ